MFKSKYTITTNRRNGQKIQENRKRIWFNKSGRFATRVYFFHPLIQQEEIWKVAGKTRIELWNQLIGRYTKEVKYQDICNNNQKRKSIKLIAI